MGKIRAKLAMKHIVENRGKSVSNSMVEAGYSPKYAHNPNQFTKTKTFIELMDEYLPEEMIAKRHDELANAGEIAHYTFPAVIKDQSVDNPNKRAGGKIKAKRPVGECISDAEIKTIVESVPGCKLIYIKYDAFQGGKMAFYQAPDSRSRKDALDMAYKLRGKYAPEQINITRRKYQDLTNEELIAKKKALQDFLRKK